MHETHSGSSSKPVLDPELVSEVAQILGISDNGACKHLAARLQRYSDRYFFGTKRAENSKTPGEVRKFAMAIDARVAVLQSQLPEIGFHDEFMAAYRNKRRTQPLKGSGSLENLEGELAALREVCQMIIKAPALSPGQKGKPALQHCVGSYMALFETSAGARPRHAAYQQGVKGDFLAGRGGSALRRVFEVIDPEVKESTLARIVAKIDAEYEGRTMQEGSFDLISAIEDTGRFAVELVQHE